MSPTRREFLATLPAIATTSAALARNRSADEALRTFLRPHVLQRETLDRFLDPKAQVWAKFDPELG